MPEKPASGPPNERDFSYDLLASAAAHAVSASTEEMARIVARVNRLIGLLKDTADEMRPGQVPRGQDDPCRLFASQLDHSREKVADLLQRQSEALRTFNIVLFGRTGAGKSSLISAMTRGNGGLVSWGESDWTTRVDPVGWHSCRVYDTPGINGWGRTGLREDLEARAREAVEIADFVLVCFDNQSQQADEFRKLAAWVHSYRKPLVAVLNHRNPVWRFPPRVEVGSARANLSRSVREHASNIRDELAKIGLTSVPVIALSSKRALFARATLPFEGPDPESLTAQREAYGIHTLERWSCYPRLENLLVRAISTHSVRLRLGALNDQLRAVFRELSSGLDELEAETTQAAEAIEKNSVEPLLNLLGYPPKDDPARRQPLLAGDNDLLAELEYRRGGAFQSSITGEFYRFITQRLEAELGVLRSRSLQEAEECIAGAFDRGQNLMADDIQKACFDETQMQETARRVLAEGAEYLERRVDLALRDAKLDLKVLLAASAINGKAGIGWKYSSWALRTGGILAGVAGALGTFALANFWNPAGWTAAAAAGVAVIGSLVASLFGWLGSKARAQAEKKRLAARRQALADARRNVHEVYDQFTEVVLKQADAHALEALEAVLREPIQHALVLRTIQMHCSSLGKEIKVLASDLSASTEPQSLLWEVATDIEREAYPGHPNATALHWLGEDWVDDPTGLKLAHGSTDSGRTTVYDPNFFDRLFSGIRDIFERITEDVTPGSGRAWLSTALEHCSEDPTALEALAELEAIAEDGRPRIHVVGDYNAGKSSFIKRLLVDAGCPIPDDLEVRANPTTDRPRPYDWDGVLLVDSPGFQSGEPAHAEAALSSVSDASAVIYLFQPNLVLGDDQYLTMVLLGREDLGLVPKQERTFFIVNRSDELGVDPHAAPEAYRQLVERKKAELSLALGSRQVTVPPEQVFCMASDPYGLVGNRTDADASAFDPYRGWDGFGHFMTAFRRIRAQLLRCGCDRSVLEGGLARLARLQEGQESAVAELAAQDEALNRLQQQLNEAVAEGQRLGAKHRAELERLVTEHAAGFREEILSEQDAAQLKLKADRFAEWWNDAALQVELEHWANTTARAFDTWQERSFEAVSRRLESAEFRAAFGQYREKTPDTPEAAEGKRWFREAVDKVGKTLGGATRDVVYQVGKRLGVKFNPWGAVKMAKALGKVGAVMAVLGVALDVVDLFVEERRYKKREEARKQIARFLQESVPRVVDTVASGDKDDPGLLRSLDAAIGVFRDLESQQAGPRKELLAAMDDARRKLAVYRQLRLDAKRILGNPWEVR